jgi:hypothetical protein
MARRRRTVRRTGSACFALRRNPFGVELRTLAVAGMGVATVRSMRSEDQLAESSPQRVAVDAPVGHRGRGALRLLAAVLGPWLLVACGVSYGDAWDDVACEQDCGDGGSAPSGKPSGYSACYDRYFAKESFECADIQCGPALVCDSDIECLSCVDRCQPFACGSDADCEAKNGSLCDGVEWRCESFITAEDHRCRLHEVGESRCGDAACAADEDCGSCPGDCGYCPGSAPAMAPCTSNDQCASGVCDGWCVQGCDNGYDCISYSGKVVYVNGECVYANSGVWNCFPSCSTTNDCAEYPGTHCVSATNDFDTSVKVCSS